MQQGIVKDVIARTEEFKTLFDSPTPHKVSLPAPWNDKLSDFEKMLVKNLS